jgi:hypothetical protein
MRDGEIAQMQEASEPGALSLLGVNPSSKIATSSNNRDVLNVFIRPSVEAAAITA